MWGRGIKPRPRSARAKPERTSEPASERPALPGPQARGARGGLARPTRSEEEGAWTEGEARGKPHRRRCGGVARGAARAAGARRGPAWGWAPAPAGGREGASGHQAPTRRGRSPNKTRTWPPAPHPAGAAPAKLRSTQTPRYEGRRPEVPGAGSPVRPRTRRRAPAARGQPERSRTDDAVRVSPEVQPAQRARGEGRQGVGEPAEPAWGRGLQPRPRRGRRPSASERSERNTEPRGRSPRGRKSGVRQW